MLYNGLAITGMLSRLQNMFEEQRIELETELDDQDYEDTGCASLDDIYKSMRIVGMMTNQFDEDIKDFISFLAMRHSKSLD